jgi:catechol 2,3-dioxygenase
VRRRVAASDAGRVLDERTDEHGLGEAFRFVGPAGITYEAYVAMTRGTLAPERFLGPLVRKFGHLTFHCEQHDELVSFWTTILGFRLSDYAEGTTWVRCDSDHHGLAVASVPGAYRLHHHAWEIQDVGTLTKYCDNIALKGHSLLWGPVRHGPGFNIATYLADPDGAVTEVYADLLRIDDDSNYTAVDWSAETRALNLWGPRPSDELLTAGTPILGRPAAVAEGVA